MKKYHDKTFALRDTRLPDAGVKQSSHADQRLLLLMLEQSTVTDGTPIPRTVYGEGEDVGWR